MLICPERKKNGLGGSFALALSKKCGLKNAEESKTF